MTTENTEVSSNIPDDLSYNETDLYAARERIKATNKQQIYKGVVTKAAATVADSSKTAANNSYNLQLDLSYKILDGNDQPVGPAVRQWITVPIPNTRRAGHKPFADADQRNKQFAAAREFIRAVEGDNALPQFAKKREDQTGVYFDPATGENVTRAEQTALANRIDKMTVDKLLAWYKAPQELVAASLFFTTYVNKKGYTNVGFVRSDAGGREVVTAEFMEAVPETV
jgi:hypothetical protein